jgi:hypothetical protein
VQIYEVFCFAISSVLLSFRVFFEWLINADECKGASQEMTCLIFFIVTASFSVIHWYLAYRIYKVIRWQIYKGVGALQQVRDLWGVCGWRYRCSCSAASSMQTKAVYDTYLKFSSAKLLDVQFAVLILFTGFIFFHTHLDAMIPLIILIVTEPIWIVLGYYGFRKEKKWAMNAFLIMAVLLPLYIVYVSVFGVALRQVRVGVGGSQCMWWV